MIRFMLIYVGSCWIIRALCGLLVHYRFYHWIREQYRLATARSATALYSMIFVPSLIMIAVHIVKSLIENTPLYWPAINLFGITFIYGMFSLYQLRGRHKGLTEFYAKGTWRIWVYDWIMFLYGATMYYYALR